MYSQYCGLCGWESKNHLPFCYGCLASVEPSKDHFEIGDYTGLSLFHYCELNQSLLVNAKYLGFKRSLVDCIRFLIRYCSLEFSLPTLSNNIVWVPIPLHWTRQRDRGFNQSELVANVLCQQFGGEVRHLLKRPKENRSLTQMSAQSRKQNSVNIFRRVKQIRPLKQCVIVDDLVTTGSTLIAALSCFDSDELNEEFQLFTAFQGLGNGLSDYQIEQFNQNDSVNWL